MTTARNWYADEYDFRQLCGDAQSQARGESVFIGQNITVPVTQVKGGQVSIGIDAPREVPILRDNAKNYAPREHSPGLCLDSGEFIPAAELNSR